MMRKCDRKSKNDQALRESLWCSREKRSRLWKICADSVRIACQDAQILSKFGPFHPRGDDLTEKAVTDQNHAPVAQLDRVPGYEPGGR
ncbi:MAG: hypothetical protein ACC707_09335, partial [Thiohalomonadales bacterium]